MKYSKEEKAARRAAFRAMSPAKKREHIFTYYKWPILLGLIVLAILGSALHRQLAKKEPVLYLAFANVAVGDDLADDLTEAYLQKSGADLKRQEIYLYRDLYLSENADTLNHQYAYASQMKLMAAIQAQELDLVLMNQEAYDALSARAYLLPIDEKSPGLDPDLWRKLSPFLTSNEVIISDNSIAWQLGEADTHEIKTETVTNGFELTDTALLKNAGFDEPVYLGVIANSPRIDSVISYLSYLMEEA